MTTESGPSYLLRFDDICPTMRWKVWDHVEEILLAFDIKPIMAVIPDNRDRELHLEPANSRFWSRVRAWQAQGWSVGIHGFQHTYVTERPGLYSHRRASEFAGLPSCAQRDKLRRASAILNNEGVSSTLWVAPGHSFDRTTVRLLGEFGITSISDGFAVAPYTDEYGLFWIPQQLSEKQVFSVPGQKPIALKSAGVWTACFHSNAWGNEELTYFRSEVVRYRNLLRTVSEVEEAYRNRRMDWIDRINIVKLEFRRQLRLWLT